MPDLGSGTSESTTPDLTWVPSNVVMGASGAQDDAAIKETPRQPMPATESGDLPVISALEHMLVTNPHLPRPRPSPRAPGARWAFLRVGLWMKLAPILSIGLAGMVAACGLDAGNFISRGDDYESVVRKADDARKAGDIDSAVPLYGRALEIYPNGLEAKLGLGEAYLSVGAADQAAAMFNDVLAKRGSDAAARRGLARALIAMGKIPLAERQLEVVLQADARDFRAKCNGCGARHTGTPRRSASAISRRHRGEPRLYAAAHQSRLSLAISGEYQAAIDVLAPIADSRAAMAAPGRTWRLPMRSVAILTIPAVAPRRSQ